MEMLEKTKLSITSAIGLQEYILVVIKYEKFSKTAPSIQYSIDKKTLVLILEENKKLSSNVKIMETHIRITVAKLEVFPVRCKVSAL